VPGPEPVVEYDELGLFHENAAEWGLPYDGPPEVRRTAVTVTGDRAMSALVWGSAPAELVLVHGGAQNAHTWDTVAMALHLPLVAVDLPGHGHSDGPRSESATAYDHAEDVADAITELAPDARAVVGMSLGGLTSLALAQRHPQLVRRLALVDVTPGVTPSKGAAITAFINGPATFPSFDALLARTIEHNPTRSESSLRRGILHNAVQQPDGSWVWRWARFPRRERPGPELFATLWDAVSELTMPLMLVRGTRDGSVVDDDDVAELLRRQPAARVEPVDAGHSVQGDAPLELAALIASFLE